MRDDEDIRYHTEMEGIKMPSIDDVFSGRTLRASDIEGKNPIVTITSAVPKDFEERDGTKKKKIELGFLNATKVLVCNKTNSEEIARITKTRDYSLWVGHKIQLVVGMTPMGPGIMVRVPGGDKIETGIQPRKSVKEEMDDEIPF